MKLLNSSIIAAVITLLIHLPCVAQSSVWQVSKHNDYIYIGGTIHILPQSAFPLPKAFITAYQASDTIVLEAEIPDPHDSEFQNKLLSKMLLTAPQTLSDLLSHETRQALAQYLQANHLDLSMVNNFKAGFAVTMLATIAAKNLHLDGTGVDQYFDQLASSEQKTKEYLESSDFQLELIANMGQGNEDALINSTLEQLVDFQSTFEQLLAAWRNGNVDSLNTLVIQPMQTDDPQSFKTMITDRNQQWISKIETLFNDKEREFVLVGVGHLIGEHSVLQLLARNGYQVTQL